MKDVGTILEECKVFDLSERGTGLHLFVLPDGASRHDIEALRDVLEAHKVEALLVMASVVKEVRHLDKHTLENLRASVHDALGLVWARAEAESESDLTPERVISALEKKPKLFAGVRKMLQEHFKDHN